MTSQIGLYTYARTLPKIPVVQALDHSVGLLPVQRLDVLLGESDTARWTFALTRGDSVVQTGLTESYGSSADPSSEVNAYKARSDSLCIHLVMTCCLKLVLQQEHRRRP